MADSPQQPTAGKRIPVVTRFIATGAFSGYAPVAPGTAGSAVALLVALLPGFAAPLPLGIAALAAFLVGIPAAGALERVHGKDPSIVVIDEVAGMWISLLFLPATLWSFLCAFLAFRFFDIVKPPPARQLERIEGGIGIMLDDVVAGIYANLACQVIVRLVGGIFA